jgi:ABC-type Fe3+/spermidine/putrescine transport system ATPase subunit
LDKIGGETKLSNKIMKTSAFQQAIESVESLSIEDQEILLDIIQKRLQQKRRTQLCQEIKEIRQEFAEGKVKFGSVDQFLEQLDRQ